MGSRKATSSATIIPKAGTRLAQSAANVLLMLGVMVHYEADLPTPASSPNEIAVPEIAARNAIRAFLEQVIATGLPFDRLRGVAGFNPERDAPLTALTSFEAASQAIAKLPNLADRFGQGISSRIALQFVYQYFE